MFHTYVSTAEPWFRHCVVAFDRRKRFVRLTRLFWCMKQATREVVCVRAVDCFFVFELKHHILVVMRGIGWKTTYTGIVPVSTFWMDGTSVF